MQHFQDTFEKRKQLFISASLICMAVTFRRSFLSEDSSISQKLAMAAGWHYLLLFKKNIPCASKLLPLLADLKVLGPLIRLHWHLIYDTLGGLPSWVSFSRGCNFPISNFPIWKYYLYWMKENVKSRKLTLKNLSEILICKIRPRKNSPM